MKLWSPVSLVIVQAWLPTCFRHGNRDLLAALAAQINKEAAQCILHHYLPSWQARRLQGHIQRFIATVMMTVEEKTKPLPLKLDAYAEGPGVEDCHRRSNG